MALSGKGLVSYPSLFKKTRFGSSGKEYYEITLLFDKDDAEQMAAVKALREDAERAAIEKWGKVPKNCMIAIRDGDVERDDPVYENKIFVHFKTQDRPTVVGRKKEALEEGFVGENGCKGFYPGCMAHVTYRAYTWEYESRKGVGFGLNNVQKCEDGEPLGGGRRSADEDFDVLEPGADLEDLESMLS